MPPTVQHLADQVSEWLHSHHGPGVLFDCQLAAGDVCLFAFMPEHVGSHFAGAVQFVRGHPFFRLVSRGALHHTPADRLRFLTFQTDEANTLAIPLAASSASLPRSPVPGSRDVSQDEDGEASEGYSLLQKTARISRVTKPLSLLRQGSTAPESGASEILFAQVLAAPSPLRRGTKTSHLPPSVSRDSLDWPVSTPGCIAAPSSTPHNGAHASEDESCPLLACHVSPAEPNSALRTLGCSMQHSNKVRRTSQPPDTCELSGTGTMRGSSFLHAVPHQTGEGSLLHHTGLCKVLAVSTPIRDLASLLHSVTVWGHECWRPIQQLRFPGWIRRLLPPTKAPSGTGAPTAYHVYTDGSTVAELAGGLSWSQSTMTRATVVP